MILKNKCKMKIMKINQNQDKIFKAEQFQLILKMIVLKAEIKIIQLISIKNRYL